MSVTVGKITIVHGKDGKESGRTLVRCFMVGDFAAHETHRNPRYWTCTHTPTGLAVASYIASAFDAIECAERADSAARLAGLDTSLGSFDDLKAHSGWRAFADQAAELRDRYSIWSHENNE